MSVSTVRRISFWPWIVKTTFTSTPSRKTSPSVEKSFIFQTLPSTRLTGPVRTRKEREGEMMCRLLITSKNREFMLYYDIEKDSSSRIYNTPGMILYKKWLVGYQEMKKGVMCITPNGETALLISEKGMLFTIDLQTRHITTLKQLASPICDACFYDNSTCYLLTSRFLGDSLIHSLIRRGQYDLRIRHCRANHPYELLG